MVGRRVIVKAFFRWSEKAGSTDRSKAATTLAKAYLQSSLPLDRYDSAHDAMTYLLDDPSPKVRLALAEALAYSDEAPRHIIFSLAQDQPEIACLVIIHSPVLRDTDLVDLVGNGTPITRAMIAARPYLEAGACAALSEIGELLELSVLLENRSACITPFTLRRISERHAQEAEIRDLLLRRDDLPADVRYALVGHIGAALAASDLVCYAMTPHRALGVIRDASETATVLIAGDATGEAAPMLVEHLRAGGGLTPAFLMNTLCSGKLDFFAQAISNLSGLEERQVRSILATGRHHALKALYHSAGLFGAVLDIFMEATLLWRNASDAPYANPVADLSSGLLAKFAHVDGDATMRELLHMVEKLQITQQRQRARSLAIDLVAEAA
ncbi:DUF2336 domain-containing protein [Agrobacterium rosae]|uniref:DUF2336 domain-containing protein n=1 Tax=Agrobacterium rosae TaxID=1972867 RepID=UPI0019D32DE3|nr:DUF2336 domain-containing protein [Agrobacterium rosae]MBN7808048.1 DUF2336 domain-containing protein [Agrobacterium rosae]